MSIQEHKNKGRRPPFDDALRERAIALAAELLDLLDGRDPPPPPGGPQLRLLRGGQSHAARILKRA